MKKRLKRQLEIDIFIVNANKGTEAVFSSYKKAREFLYSLGHFKPGFDENNILYKDELLYGYCNDIKVWIDKRSLNKNPFLDE